MLESVWFTNSAGCVGIVRVTSDYGTKYYVSAVPGVNKENDEQYIVNFGAQFPTAAGNVLFGVAT